MAAGFALWFDRVVYLDAQHTALNEVHMPDKASRARTLLQLAIPLVAAGCHRPTDPGNNVQCPAMIAPAIIVQVREAGTNLQLAAVGFAQTGTTVDSLRPYSSGTGDTFSVPGFLSLQAVGPAGIYHVELSHAGYRPFVANDVNVTAGKCGPNTVTLHADLVPAMPEPAGLRP